MTLTDYSNYLIVVVFWIEQLNKVLDAICQISPFIRNRHQKSKPRFELNDIDVVVETTEYPELREALEIVTRPENKGTTTEIILTERPETTATTQRSTTAKMGSKDDEDDDEMMAMKAKKTRKRKAELSMNEGVQKISIATLLEALSPEGTLPFRTQDFLDFRDVSNVDEHGVDRSGDADYSDHRR